MDGAAGGNSDLRADASERDVVARVHIHVDAAAERTDGRVLTAILQEPAFGANAEHPIAIEIPDESAGDAVPLTDEIIESANRLRDGEIDVAVGTRKRRVGAAGRRTLCRERRCDCTREYERA